MKIVFFLKIFVFLFSLDVFAQLPPPNFAVVHPPNVWDKTQLSVCWKTNGLNPSESSYQNEKTIVRNAIQNTWARYSKLEFTGWQNCPNEDFDIIINIENSTNGPRVSSNTQADGELKPLMYLNFTFSQWSPYCATSESIRINCIKNIAVHEFGHAIGFFHEQNREDTPRNWCLDEPQGITGTLSIGAWDLFSVMNYCNPSWNGNGELSRVDIKSVQALYGVGQVIIENNIAEPVNEMAFGPDDLQVFLTKENKIKYRTKAENFREAPPFPAPNQNEFGTKLKTINGEIYVITNSKSIFRMLVNNSQVTWVLYLQNQTEPIINLTDFIMVNGRIILIDDSNNYLEYPSKRILTLVEFEQFVGKLPVDSLNLIKKVDSRIVYSYGVRKNVVTVLDNSNRLFYKNCETPLHCNWTEIPNPEGNIISDIKLDPSGKFWTLDAGGKVSYITPPTWTPYLTKQTIAKLELDVGGNPQMIDVNGNFIDQDDQCQIVDGVAKFKCLQNMPEVIKALKAKDEEKTLIEDSFSTSNLFFLVKIGFEALHAVFITEAALVLKKVGLCPLPSYASVVATTALLIKAEFAFYSNSGKLKAALDIDKMDFSKDQTAYIDNLISYNKKAIAILEEYRSDYNWLAAIYFANVPVALGELAIDLPCLASHPGLTRAKGRAIFSGVMGVIALLLNAKVTSAINHFKEQDNSLKILKSNFEQQLQSFFKLFFTKAWAETDLSEKVCMKKDYTVDPICECVKNSTCLKFDINKFPKAFKNNKDYQFLFEHLNAAMNGVNKNKNEADQKKLNILINQNGTSVLKALIKAESSEPKKYELNKYIDELIKKSNQVQVTTPVLPAFINKTGPLLNLERKNPLQSPSPQMEMVQNNSEVKDEKLSTDEYLLDDIQKDKNQSIWKILSNRYLVQTLK